MARDSSILALDYGPSALKFVELAPDASGVLAAGSVAFAGDAWRSEGGAAQALRAVLARAKAFDGGVLGVALPRCHGFARQVEIPADAEDAASALRWEFGQYLARPVELYAVDHQRLAGPGPSGGLSFLSAAYRLSEVERLLRAFEAAGAPRPRAADLDAFSVINALAFNYPEQRSERALVVQADAHATVCYRAQDGEYLDGAVDFPEALPASGPARDEALARRADAIVENLRLALREWTSAERLFLCGELSADPVFREHLKARGTTEFSLLNPFLKLKGPEPGTHPDVYPGAPFAAAVGLALRLAGDR